jgi:hypothetical protein
MMNLSNAVIKLLSTHYVGNKNNEQELILSDKCIHLEEGLDKRLKDYFTTKISTLYDRYQFTHGSSLDFNEVYSFVKEMFKNMDDFHDMSAQIGQHLYDKTEHPNIKPGELHVCYFTNCILDNVVMDGIGIFKTEIKTGFFEVNREGETDFAIEYREGIDLKKFDKGCFIFNKDEEDGYETVIFDNQNKGDEAKYWREQFLNVTQRANEFQQTSQVMTIAKEFIANQITEEFEVPKADQMDMLNKSVDYFKGHEEFKQDEFAEEVFQNNEVAESFKHFDQGYRADNDLENPGDFEISAPALKKQEKSFKSVLKLDKNFSIYIHGDRKQIEQGMEDNGRKYYKIYYTEEI